MAVAEQITEALKSAMKERNQLKMDALRMVKSDFKNAEIDKKAPLAEDEMLAIVQKGIKKRREAIELFKTGGRQDLVDKEQREVDILSAFLPAQMGEAEIRALAQDAIATAGAASKKDMHKVMGALMPKVKGRADGKLVHEIVLSLLPA
ncbi:MAG: aspartyl-tRNA amidotransferase [Candidatus Lindowbacteria bacterium RIFCSPLOWO2_12_FULL_62_27]|nr:MAG: aspartyl-tRNA amidotransferase [Candidatus Lindowbacteria bacterium RIFCSPLOWO2_12_FULL_62_27]OGH63942.1 MAG: aspartyl-tRNA amidotransferase [Candidatus Lindowbacteria bacterium RIFCSPLOWO2_02_FULL_62_12]